MGPSHWSRYTQLSQDAGAVVVIELIQSSTYRRDDRRGLGYDIEVACCNDEAGPESTIWTDERKPS